MASVLTTASLPITYNPPPHPSIQFITPDLGADAANIPIEGPPGLLLNPKPPVQNQYQLGSIYMGEAGFTYALKEAGTKYGFRFLYNPTTISGGQSVGTDFIPDPSDTVTAVLQEGLEILSFQILLNRQPEVQGDASGSDWSAPVAEADMVELRNRGTHYDLEFLYRVCNGLHNTTYRQGTGDIGILLPNPCYLDLGPFHTRGALMSIGVTDIMFNDRMVPMLTWVNIAFSRYLSMKPTSDSDRFKAQPGSLLEALNPPKMKFDWFSMLTSSFNLSLIPDIGGGDESGGGETEEPSTGGGGGGGSGGAGRLTGAQVQKLAKDAGWTSEKDSRLMTKIAWAESGWNPKSHNPRGADNSYGLWQINMKGDMGPSRRKQFGISSNEALFNPSTNAKAARSIWRGQGLTAWTTYTSGKYREAPSW